VILVKVICDLEMCFVIWFVICPSLAVPIVKINEDAPTTYVLHTYAVVYSTNKANKQ